MPDPRLAVAREAFRTVSIALRDDILDAALLAVLHRLDDDDVNRSPVEPKEPKDG